MKFQSLSILLFLLFSQCTSPAETEVSDALTENVIESYPNGTAKTVHYNDPKSLELLKQKIYYENGNIQSEGELENGRRHGEWKAYYENGGLWSLNTYIEGVFNGPYKTWFENGQLRIEGQYKQGKPSGIWKYFNEQGVLAREDDQDQPISETPS